MPFGLAENYWRLQGSLHIGDRNLSTGGLAATGLTALGDASELTFTTNQQFAEHREHQSGKGKKDVKIAISTDMPITITLDNLSSANLTTFLQGAQAAIAGATVTAESHTAPAVGKSFVLDKPIVATFTSITSDPAGTTFVDGTDYRREGNLIYVPTGSAMAGDPVLVNYVAGAATQVDLMAAAAKNYYFYFQGINTVNNKRLILQLWKVHFDAGQLQALISDNMTMMQIQGEALNEPLKEAVDNLGGFGYFQYQD